MAKQPPTEEEVLGYFDSCSNWGRWGPEDQLGTVNFITPERRRKAAALVRDGVSVTCSRPITTDLAPDVVSQPIHLMEKSGEKYAGKKSGPEEFQSSSDWFGMRFHGFTITHIDSLAHIFWDGKMYNGHPAELVVTAGGATVESIDLLKDGIVTRGVLLDLPRLRERAWLDDVEPIYPEDLEEAEKASGVRVESGDVLLVRTGALRRRNEEGPGPTSGLGRPGLQAACLPWLHEREIAFLGSDTHQDISPSGYPRVALPIHSVGIVAMGLWLIDNANLEELAAACEQRQRWEFLLTFGPLRIHNGTGSPINPIAVF
jgi:kynurenine formamidase